MTPFPDAASAEAREAVADIVRDALGEPPSEVMHVPTLEDSDVYRCRLGPRTVFFKAEHEGHPVAVAAWAMRRAAAAGLPVPEVLHRDDSLRRWPKELMLVTAVGGTDLEHDPPDATTMAGYLERLGALLRTLHAVELDGFGDLSLRPGADPAGAYADHAAALRAAPRWGLPYLAGRGLVDAATVAQIGEVLDRHEELVTPPARGVLLHGDIGLDHVFVEDGRITGLIDFEPASGDPVADLASFAFHYPDLGRHVLAGYGELPDDLEVRMELYGLVRAVGSARWEHERGLDVAYALSEIGRRCRLLLHRLGAR